MYLHIIGGQKQASRVSRLIQTCTRQVKKLLSQYQELQVQNGESPQATVKEVLDLHSNFWISEHTYATTNDADILPASSQRRLVELCNIKERSMEEKQIVIADLIRITSFYSCQLEQCTARLFDILSDHNDSYTSGQLQICSSDLYVAIEQCVESLSPVEAGKLAALIKASQLSLQNCNFMIN